MIPYPQYTVIQLESYDKPGGKIDVNKIPGVDKYERCPNGEIFRLYLDLGTTSPKTYEMLSFIRKNKIRVIDKEYIKARQRRTGSGGVNFDSTFKTACLYVASAAVLAAPLVIAGYYTGINTGDWNHASKMIHCGIAFGACMSIGTTIYLKERFSNEIDGNSEYYG